MKKLFITSLCVLWMLSFWGTTAFAIDFDDSYCENEFDGEELWTSEIAPGKFSGHQYDSENGIYQYDWVHQIWDSDHEQLYVQQRYTMSVSMSPILVTAGEMLNDMTYSIKVADYSTDRLLIQYSTIDDIEIPEGYSCKKIQVSGYDAVYIYTEGKTEGDGQGILPSAYNRGTIYVPIVGSLNEEGRTNTLQIVCTMTGASWGLYDSMVGDYLGLIEALPCTITLDSQEKVFKEGAPTGGSTEPSTESDSTPEQSEQSEPDSSSDHKETDTDAEHKEGLPTGVIVVGAAVIVGGAAIALSVNAKKKKVTPVSPKTTVQLEKEAQHQQYVEKLKDKYNCVDEKELKKVIKSQQVLNEQRGYRAQADMAYADAALHTAENIKTTADVTVSALGAVTGTAGTVVKDIYAAGTTIGEDVVTAVTEGKDAWDVAQVAAGAVTKSAVSVIQNHATGVVGKSAADIAGGAVSGGISSYVSGEDVGHGIAKGTASGVLNATVDAGGEMVTALKDGSALNSTAKNVVSSANDVLGDLAKNSSSKAVEESFDKTFSDLKPKT